MFVLAAVGSGELIVSVVSVLIVNLAAILIAYMNRQNINRGQDDIRRVKEQVTNNGGGSMKDAVDRIERRIETLHEASTIDRNSLHSDLRHQEEKLDRFILGGKDALAHLWEAIAMTQKWPDVPSREEQKRQ